jgi:hypothetical protein
MIPDEGKMIRFKKCFLFYIIESTMRVFFKFIFNLPPLSEGKGSILKGESPNGGRLNKIV